MEQTLNADVGYLLLHEPPYGPQYRPDPGVSQYMRRCIAVKLGIPDEWDYLLFPRLENVTETARALAGRFVRYRSPSGTLRNDYVRVFYRTEAP